MKTRKRNYIIYLEVQWVATSLSHSDLIFQVSHSSQHNNNMPRLEGTPRRPMQELTPGERNRIVSARDHGVKFAAIARLEEVADSTCRKVFKNAPNQVSCITKPRVGAPSVLSTVDKRNIHRAIVVNPKITAAQLFDQCAPHASKKTIYRYLKKSGIQKWRCKQRPFLTEEHAEKRRAWARLYDGRPIAFWRRIRWSDECSIERGRGGAIEWVYRRPGK